MVLKPVVNLIGVLICGALLFCASVALSQANHEEAVAFAVVGLAWYYYCTR